MNNLTDSVGIVKPQKAVFDSPLQLDCGKKLKKIELVYETYGSLNERKDNAVLICHALSGDHHAAGYNSPDDKKPGWWDVCIGPGKPFDTNKFFIVCPNNIGGCKGSSGPNAVNPETGKLYGPSFPIVTVEDWVNTQNLLGDSLGIKKWACIIGGSLGGMQALQWTISFPEKVQNIISVAAASKLSAQNIAFNEVARQSIINDPDFRDGYYYEHGVIPKIGLSIARMLGHITYLSDDSMRQKFGRDLKEGKLNFSYDVDFQVESYLRYQGKSFVDKFDANTYLLMTKVLDYYDPASRFGGDLSKAFEKSDTRFFIISFTSDWLYPTIENREIVIALNAVGKDVGFVEIKSDKGHDSFLLDVPDFLNAVKNFLNTSYNKIK